VIGLLLILSWISLYRFSRSVAGGLGMSWEDTLHLLLGAAYICLLVGLLGLRRAILLIRKQPLPPIRMRFIIFLGFILPFLVCVVPISVFNLMIDPASFQPADLIFSFQIWLPVLQIFSLGCVLLLGERFDLHAYRPGNGNNSLIKTGLISLGLWLAGMYSYQLLILANPSGSQPGALNSPVVVGFSILLVLCAPILEGLFFRGRLLPYFRLAVGPTAGIVLCAAVSALLYLQPILWLPAFIAALGFNYLAVQTGGLRAAIFAHAFFNVLSLLVIPRFIH
jgi:membrane protease YdiL (CAAX protease family)